MEGEIWQKVVNEALSKGLFTSPDEVKAYYDKWAEREKEFISQFDPENDIHKTFILQAFVGDLGRMIQKPIGKVLYKPSRHTVQSFKGKDGNQRTALFSSGVAKVNGKTYLAVFNIWEENQISRYKEMREDQVYELEVILPKNIGETIFLSVDDRIKSGPKVSNSEVDFEEALSRITLTPIKDLKARALAASRSFKAFVKGTLISDPQPAGKAWRIELIQAGDFSLDGFTNNSVLTVLLNSSNVKGGKGSQVRIYGDVDTISKEEESPTMLFPDVVIWDFVAKLPAGIVIGTQKPVSPEQIYKDLINKSQSQSASQPATNATQPPPQEDHLASDVPKDHPTRCPDYGVEYDGTNPGCQQCEAKYPEEAAKCKAATQQQ